MIVCIKILLAHLLGDFMLQPNSWVADKEAKKQKSIYLYIHSFLHGVIALLFINTTAFIPYAIALSITHGVIDYLKLRFQKNKTKRKWFLADQGLHLVVIVIISMLYTNTTINFTAITDKIWFFTTGLILLTVPTSIVIKNLISIWTPENKKKDNSLSNAGKYIGILERLFVFCFIITNHFEAIGFLLAAKSIFRFGDLKEAKDRKLTEYVLIGTLLSFGIAIATGLIVTFSSL
jgi:hypothetical protein